MDGVYLIHFDTPFKHACHYLGWAKNIDKRISEHRANQGEKLIQAVNLSNISWSVVRTWEHANRELEKSFKRRGSLKVLCPVCRKDTLKRKAEYRRRHYRNRREL